MNRDTFETARRLYQEKEYRRAARMFLDAVEPGTPLDNGAAYHLAGNAFMHLKRYRDAITVYEQALRDDSYQKRGAIESNLANAYLQDGDFSQAVAHYEAALEESSTYEPYKCYQGLGAAYFERHHYDKAALAYKQAALDERNGNPGAALVNLGLCLMALGRPEAAIDAYGAALGCDSYKNHGKALANMGMAHYAAGNYAKTVHMLEEASVLHKYPLSEAAQRALADSKEKLAHPENEPASVVEATVPHSEQPVAVSELPTDITPQGTPPVQAAPGMDQATARQDPVIATSPVSVATGAEVFKDDLPPEDGMLKIDGGDDTGVIKATETEVEQFFALSEKDIAKKAKKEKHAERGVWVWLKPVLIVLIVLAVLAGAAAAVFATGFGVPSISSTITRLFDDYDQGGVLDSYWSSNTSRASRTREMAAIPTPSDVTIDSIDTDIMESTARITVTSGSSTKLKFMVVLERHMFGWKVFSITGDY